MALPSLENLAYPADDDEHPEGGHCASLGGGSPEENRVAIVDQWATALRALVETAEASGDRWSLSRPILFAVHQLCEDALDVANARRGVKVKGKAPRHSLAARMTAAIEGGVYAGLTDEESQWCEDFVAKVDPLTGNGFPGRYADGQLSGNLLLDDVWCCINPAALRDAAIVFADLTLLASAELEASKISAP